LKGNFPVDELRLIEDWTLEREFKSIPGVADVVSFGGPTRTIDVKLDVTRLRALGLTVSNVAQALGQNHANAGGTMITHGEEGYIVRSIGLYEKPENLEAAVVMTQKNVPVRVRDIGQVQVGHKPRLGIVGHNEDDDVVEGIILLRQGADSLETCKQIREKIENLNASVLPKGANIQTYYDRTDLIRRSSKTVFHNVIFGIILVCLVLWFGLGVRYWVMTLAVGLIIPFSLLMVFIGLKIFGFTPNLISLGAVDFGIIIETAIFSAEAVIVALSAVKERRSLKADEVFANILGPALLCALLLVIAFIPILSLQRVEGRIFRPLGITLVAALLGGQIGTFIFIPLASLLSPLGSASVSRADLFFEKLLQYCYSIGQKVLKQKNLYLKVSGILAIAIGLLVFNVGREFLPNLNEGSLYIRVTAPPTISIDAAAELAAKIRSTLKSIPEVVNVVSQTGRPDDGTDVNGFDNIEIFVSLKPPEDWKSAKTLDGFVKIAQEKLKDVEGVEFNFSQPIKDNVDEAISGVKGELVVKVFGPQLPELQQIGNSIESILKKIPGAEDVASEQLLGQPELRFNMDRNLLARYGLRVTDAEDVLETALMGKTAAKMTDDQGRNVDIVVKPDLPENPNINILSSLPVISPDGVKVPLGEVTSANLVEGVGRVYRETGARRIAVKCSVRGRDVVGFVQEAMAKISKEFKLPARYHMQWSGSFENAERASQQLMLVVPVCMLTMVVLLYTWFGQWSYVGYLLWQIPFSSLGGFLFLKLFGLNFSISAAAGAIVLIGVTFLTGMMLISEWIQCGDIWHALKEKGRSIIISNGVAIIGLVPAAFSQGIGSETAKPFAVMILGGLTSSLILSLLVLPALISSKTKSSQFNKC
ncbi:MAG: efflux RND transporter permease subunit, partial [Pseudobdellovibrionaceae bacterium]